LITIPRCWSKGISTWYQSACSERKKYIISIEVYRISIIIVGDLIRSITSRHKSKDGFQGNNNTKEEIGFCSFTELYVGCRRNRHVHMQVSLETIKYMWVLVSTNAYIHDF
jgi:hypothetical protein